MPFEIDHTSPVPLHAQIEEKLRTLLNKPEYQDGKMLPKEVELAKLLGISRNTIRQATNKLVYEGLLVRKKGVGTKVAGKAVSTKLSSWLSFTQEMNEKGIPFNNYEIEVEWVRAGKDIGNFFSISPNKNVLRMSRLRGLEEGPIVYFISYFHPRVGLTGEEDFTQPLYKILEEQHATKVAVSKEEISAIAAEGWIAEKLDVPIDTPILFRKRFVHDPGDRPVEYNLGYYRSDNFTYSIEIKREKD